MARVTLQDIQRSLDITIRRWEYPFEHTEAAMSWRACGNDLITKGFLRQHATDILNAQLAKGELVIEYLRVDATCALIEAMAKKPKIVIKGRADLRRRALMRRTLQVLSPIGA